MNRRSCKSMMRYLIFIWSLSNRRKYRNCNWRNLVMMEGPMSYRIRIGRKLRLLLSSLWNRKLWPSYWTKSKIIEILWMQLRKIMKCGPSIERGTNLRLTKRNQASIELAVEIDNNQFNKANPKHTGPFHTAKMKKNSPKISKMKQVKIVANVYLHQIWMQIHQEKVKYDSEC